MNKMKQMIHEMKKIKAIKKAINVKKHQNEIHLLSVLVEEIHNSIEAKGIKYFIHYTNDNYTEHIESYRTIAYKAKNQVLSDLQELQSSLNRKDIQRCNAIVDKLVESNFLIKDTERKFSTWRPLQRANFKKKFLTI